MPADPSFGAGYFQEFAPGVAEDEAIVVGLGETVTINRGDFEGVLQTLDTTALEPDVAEFKYYAPGVGLILTEELDSQGEMQSSSELVDMRTFDDHVADQLLSDFDDDPSNPTLDAALSTATSVESETSELAGA